MTLELVYGTAQRPVLSDNIEALVPSGVRVRCFFRGVDVTEDPADLTFARVPGLHEGIVHNDRAWSVLAVTWAPEGPFLDLWPA